MTYFAYSADNEQMLKMLDDEFKVAVVVGNPEDGLSKSYDVAIYADRTTDEIHKTVTGIEKQLSEESYNGTQI